MRFASALIVLSVMGAVTPSAALEYTVGPGEVLSNIAQAHSTSVQAIVDANSIADPDVILVGQILTIPNGSTTGSELPSTHVVRSGDTLWSIALSYDVPLGALARMNNIEGPTLIFPGQVLGLPDADGGGGPVIEPVEVPPADPEPRQHVVASGESMWRIARQYGIDLESLLDINELARSSIITPGQQIALVDPTLTPDTDHPDHAGLPADLANDPDRLALTDAFDRWAVEYDVAPELIKALAWFESGWNNELESSAGAVGIGQILPITAAFISDMLLREDLDLNDPEDNIRLSTRYLRYLLDNSDDIRSAVASYYQGLTATRQHGIYPSSEFYVDGILALQIRFE